MKEDGSQAFWSDPAKRRLPEERIWVTKDGEHVPYSQLDPSHLLHILLWLRRNAQNKAQDAALKDGVVLGPSGWRARKPPEWDGLVEEGRRRRGKVAEIAEQLDLDCEYNEVSLKRRAKLLRQDQKLP